MIIGKFNTEFPDLFYMYIETLGSCTAVDIYNVTKSYFNDSNLKPCHEMGQFYDKGYDLCSENILSCVAIRGPN